MGLRRSARGRSCAPVPADLRAAGAERMPSERPRHQLAAKAQAQHRYVSGGGLPQQLRLTPDEWDGIVEGGELRAERDDQLVVTRVRHPVVEVDAQNVDHRGALIQPLAD